MIQSAFVKKNRLAEPGALVFYDEKKVIRSQKYQAYSKLIF
jgi:hypothetical protein